MSQASPSAKRRVASLHTWGCRPSHRPSRERVTRPRKTSTTRWRRSSTSVSRKGVAREVRDVRDGRCSRADGRQTARGGAGVP
jgi:hypothetical protein